MNLFRTLNAGFDPSQPPIQWEGDVRGIIAARRAEEAARMNRLRLRTIQRAVTIPRLARTLAETPLDVAT
jgi:hypothetical protein